MADPTHKYKWSECTVQRASNSVQFMKLATHAPHRGILIKTNGSNNVDFVKDRLESFEDDMCILHRGSDQVFKDQVLPK